MRTFLLHHVTQRTTSSSLNLTVRLRFFYDPNRALATSAATSTQPVWRAGARPPSWVAVRDLAAQPLEAEEERPQEGLPLGQRPTLAEGERLEERPLAVSQLVDRDSLAARASEGPSLLEGARSGPLPTLVRACSARGREEARSEEQEGGRVRSDRRVGRARSEEQPLRTVPLEEPTPHLSAGVEEGELSGRQVDLLRSAKDRRAPLEATLDRVVSSLLGNLDQGQ